MKIHKEGYKIILFSFIILCILELVVINILPHSTISNIISVSIGFLLFYLIVRFFRFPFRLLSEDENAIYAPADGKVVVIEEVFEDKYFHEKRIQVSIFMSIMNVHVNFHPISGTVISTDYFPGDKMVAWHPKSSELNEHFCTIIEDDKKRTVLVKQIAGAMARRIITIAEVGDRVEQGQELGIIKFGSRVDVLLPMNAKLNVSLNEKVKAKETVLAYFE
ncbi:MAG: phosphatidylserine decarboxylase family protein [Bacteroidales bacterium]|nr:phosphatidylserine decarboxylase family protein [Bacteroidales bacterium]